jgi:hypothetical protein
MPKRSSTPKRPRDPDQLAKLIVDTATGQAPRDAPTTGPSDGASTTWNPSPDYGNKNPAAVELGRLGGLKGGKARAKSLMATKRRAIAKKATAWWGRHR